MLRTAIGAGRARIARQLLTESIMLALTGGLGGAAIAWLGTRAVSAWRLPGELPAQLDLTADATIVFFAVSASIVVGILVGIAPARFATRLDLNQSLKGHAGYGIGRRRFQGREVLVAVQVALCVVLLHASFLAVRGLQRASTAALGWNPDGLVMAAAELGLGGLERLRFDAYNEQVLREARALPGLQSAALGNSMPLYQDQSNTTLYPLPVEEPEEGRGATFYSVSPGYFATLEIPWKAGRDFTDFDRADTEPVAVINSVLAERLFGQGNALGRQFKNGRGGAPITVVGIVETGKYVGLGENPRGAMFRPLTQNYSNSSMLIARSNGTVTMDDLRRVMLAFDPELPIRTSATGEQITAFPLLPYRAAVVALGLLGLIGSGLLLSGLHAMLAYAVTKRQKEIGIRVALGADRASVIRTVLSRVFVILAIGGAAGALVSAGTGPFVSSLVLGVSPREPVLLIAIVSLLAVIALLSSAGPVRRSLGVDPLQALRDE